MSNNLPSIAFIICSEKGILEKKSILFVKSLRKHGGILKDTPIYSISPRKKHFISATTEILFKTLNVVHQNIELNEEFDDYPLANKILACSYFEQHLDEQLLVFCDSDLIILKDINQLILEPNTDIAIQKVNNKGIGSTGNDTNNNYWQKLFKITNTKTSPLMSMQNGETIFQYFNSGLISVRRNVGLFKQWESNFREVIKQKIRPKHGHFFVEQSVLSATISGMQLRIKQLPIGYNFNFLKSTDTTVLFQKIVAGKINIFHYHKSFDDANEVKLPDGIILSNSYLLQWINDELICCGINTKPFLNYNEINAFKDSQKIINLFNNQ